VNVWENNYWSNQTDSGVAAGYVIDEHNADYAPLKQPVTLDTATPLSEINFDRYISREKTGAFDLYNFLPAILAGAATVLVFAAIISFFYKKGKLYKTKL
jgi:hypothetical protein